MVVPTAALCSKSLAQPGTSGKDQHVVLRRRELGTSRAASQCGAAPFVETLATGHVRGMTCNCSTRPAA